MRYVLEREFVDHDWCFERCREVQFEPDGYIDLWSREHGKSQCITIGKTIQDILIDPETTVGIFSHTRPISKSFLRVIKREFENNAKLKEWFDDILWSEPRKEAPKWSEDDGIIVKRHSNPPESTVEAWGLVDGQPTGRHFRLRVYDDVVTRESVSTPDQIQKTTEAMDLSDNLGQIGGKVRIIGTRYKLGDTYEIYIKRGAYKPRLYPATDNGRVDGNPVFFTSEEWERRLQTQSPAIIASQMLQNPLAEETTIFHCDWFNLWSADKQLPNFDAVYMSLDGAFSEKESADYSCLITFGMFNPIEGSAKKAAMILDFWMERLSYPKLREKVLHDVQSKFGANDCPVTAIIIEDKASGAGLIPDLRRGRIPVLSYNPGKLDKVARANIVSHYVRDGLLYIPESRNPKRKGYCMSWLGEWHEQMTYFPNTEHDDAVDATTQFLGYMAKVNWLQGKAIPPKPQTYWQKQKIGNYG